MTSAIGIDLGTGNTSAGIYLNGMIQMIPDEKGRKFVPSYVAFTNDRVLVGEPAKQQADINRKNTLHDVKRIIGRGYDDPSLQKDLKRFHYDVKNREERPKICVTIGSEEKEFYPEEISAMVLKKMKQIAEVYLGHQVTSAVITVPAFFNDSQREATKNAGTIAGLDVLRILNEPTSAAIAYGLHEVPKKDRNVLIFDLGSGTFDTSVLAIKGNNSFEVKATVGDTHLGGIDFDNVLVNYCIELCDKQYGQNVSNCSDTIRRLKIACEDAKNMLSNVTEVAIHIDNLFNDIDFCCKVTRDTFEELCSPLFSTCMDILERALNESKMEKSDIDHVVLVGGCTRIPKIQNLIRNAFEGKIIEGINPDEAVTHGAAVQAAILTGEADYKIKNLFFADVASLSIGIETSGGIMCKMIEKNAPIPCKASHIFSTDIDNQPGVTIQVFEGERALTSQNRLLGQFDLDDIPLLPQGVPQIEVTFEIDLNGILTVSAAEKQEHRARSISIRHNKGLLSKDEINHLLKIAHKFEVEDKERVERIRILHSLKNYIRTIKDSAMQSPNVKISKRDKKQIQKIYDEVTTWMEQNPNASKDEIEATKQRTISLLQPFTSLPYSPSKSSIDRSTH